MTDVARHINELLHTHNCVIVPGLGGFVTNYQPAKIHPTSHIFNGPCKSVAFNVNLSNNDGLLVNKLVSSDYINIYDAEKLISKFVEEINITLSTNKTFKIPSVGRLTLDSERNIQFLPDPSNTYLLQSYGLPSFEAKPVIRKRNSVIEEKIDVKQVVVSKKRNTRKLTQYLAWSAAAVLMISVFLQLFIQVKINGNSYADVFGFDALFQTEALPVAEYTSGTLHMHNYFLKYYRPTTAITDSIPVLPADEIDMNQVTPSVNDQVVSSESKYWIIAGVFGKTEYAVTVKDELATKGYAADIIERNALFMVAVDIAGAESNSAFRNAFAENTGISDAWILKK